MKSEHIHRKRVSPYVTQPKTLNMIMGHMAGVKVRHALCAGWVRAKELAYTALKLSPIAYALAPSPVTGALAVVNAVDTLIRVRNGDKVGLLEAGLVALSSIQGAAAQVTFTRIGDKVIASNGPAIEVACSAVPSFRSTTSTNSSNRWDLSNFRDATGYGYCAIRGATGIPQIWPNGYADPSVTALPFAPDRSSLEAICSDAASACNQPLTSNLTPTPSSTLARSTAGPTSTAFSQTTTGAVASSTPTPDGTDVITSPSLVTRPPESNNDALYAATAAAFGFGFGVGALATCGAAILRSKKAEEEQTDQPARMTSFVRPRLISESSNRSDTSDLTISPIYAVIPVAPEYYRMAPVAITLPEPVYAEPNYPPRAIESDYVDMGTVNPYENQTNL